MKVACLLPGVHDLNNLQCSVRHKVSRRVGAINAYQVPVYGTVLSASSYPNPSNNHYANFNCQRDPRLPSPLVSSRCGVLECMLTRHPAPRQPSLRLTNAPYIDELTNSSPAFGATRCSHEGRWR
ncbi:hypothetical protein Hypma_005546 [Hypsizygus marmoreus]|uniref:Uncharacterized protein n=1 Tax=Hypsizygus marmoreus TaxID=39966 RepID=A0A369K443_HYPMA|nr:hypothetical protein Hypma_005546 [Hypsizygus marmoreus]